MVSASGDGGADDDDEVMEVENPAPQVLRSFLRPYNFNLLTIIDGYLKLSISW